MTQQLLVTHLLSTMRLALLVCAAFLLSAVASARTTCQIPLRQFEVATIKPVDPSVAHPYDVTVYPGGRVRLRGYSLKSLIRTAFNLGLWQISGGEPWMEKNLYDIEAKPPQDSTPTRYDLRYTWWGIEDPRLRQMLQALLFDRFQLKLDTHPGTGMVYLLEASPKMPLLHPTEAEASEFPIGGEGFSGNVGHAGDSWVLYNTSMAQLAKFISDVDLHVPVLDRTGLSGYFDAKWTETLTDSDSFSGHDSFPLFLKALGLKLTKSTGLRETFVIEHAELPTPN